MRGPVLFALCLLLLAAGAHHRAGAEDLTRCYQGDVAGQSGERARAIELYALCIDTGDLAIENLRIAYNRLGSMRIEAGQVDRAIEDFNEVIRLDPDYANSYNNRGNAYRLKGDHSRALVHWLLDDRDAAREDLEAAHRLEPLRPVWQERFDQFEEMF